MTSREIPKEPPVPALTDEQIAIMTEAVFLEEACVRTRCDVMFVFSGTHPGHWVTAIAAYKDGLAPRIIVTGGSGKPDGREPAGRSEAEAIAQHLLEACIPREAMLLETRSRNSPENVLFAKELFDFAAISSVLFVCKSHAAGRQYRTLKKHLPSGTTYIPATFDTVYHGIRIDRRTWADTETGRSRVYGEYLRLLRYGQRGDIERLEDRLILPLADS